MQDLKKQHKPRTGCNLKILIPIQNCINMILKVKTPPNFWTIFDKSSLCAATDADFDRRSRLQTRRTFAQQKPKRKWGPDAMCHEKRMTLCICLFCDNAGVAHNLSRWLQGSGNSIKITDLGRFLKKSLEALISNNKAKVRSF